MPIHTRLVTPPADSSGASTIRSVTITEDDGIRHNECMDNFAKVKSAFPPYGEGNDGTGLNSSQVTDGGAGVVLMRRSEAQVCPRVGS